jgi:hypothetical protein
MIKEARRATHDQLLSRSRTRTVVLGRRGMRAWGLDAKPDLVLPVFRKRRNEPLLASRS